MNDAEFLAALEDGTLPSAGFTHRNHVRAAWLYLNELPLPLAASRCAATIQRYATGLGAAEKFHFTLTLAFMHIVAARRAARAAACWEDFIAAEPDLLDNAKALIGRYYSDGRLAEPVARREFLPPDRAPLP